MRVPVVVLACLGAVAAFLLRSAAPGPPLLWPPAAAASPEPVRTIRLRLAFDEEYRARGGDEAFARAQLEEANRAFEPVGVRWEVVDTIAWRSFDHARSLHDLREHLEAFLAPEVDVVLGLTGQDRRKGAGEPYDRGTAAFFGRAAVYRPFAPEGAWPFAAETMAHELGHVLGAWHTRDRDTVMRPDKTGEPVPRFDATNLEALRLARGLDFEAGVLGLDDATVARLMELWSGNHHDREYVPVAQALHQRAHAMLQAHPARALEVAQRAVALYEQAERGETKDTAQALLLVALGELHFDRTREAREILGRAHGILERAGEGRTRTAFDVRMQLGWAYEREGRLGHAASWYGDALQWRGDDVPRHKIAWVEQHLERTTRGPRPAAR